MKRPWKVHVHDDATNLSFVTLSFAHTRAADLTAGPDGYRFVSVFCSDPKVDIACPEAAWMRRWEWRYADEWVDISHLDSDGEWSPGGSTHWSTLADSTWSSNLPVPSRETMGDHPLRVDWLPHDYTVPGNLGLTILPGRRDRKRELVFDMATLADLGVTSVVCLVPDKELANVGLTYKRIAAMAGVNGMIATRLQIPDMGAPTLVGAADLTDQLDIQLSAAHHIAMFCLGGLGRAGTMASCFLIERGLDADDAIRVVRKARSPMAVETMAQERFVEAYAAKRAAE